MQFFLVTFSDLIPRYILISSCSCWFRICICRGLTIRRRILVVVKSEKEIGAMAIYDHMIELHFFPSSNCSNVHFWSRFELKTGPKLHGRKLEVGLKVPLNTWSSFSVTFYSIILLHLDYKLVIKLVWQRVTDLADIST